MCHQHRDQCLAGFKHHAANATSLAAHGPDIGLGETHSLAGIGKEHDVALAVGDGGANQVITLVKADGDNAALQWARKTAKRRLLHGAQCGGHEDKPVVIEFFNRQHHGNFFAGLKRPDVHQGLAARGAAALRNFPDLQPIHAATIGERKDHVVGIGNEKLVDPVVFFRGGCLLATAATPLRAVFGKGLAFDVARMRKRDHHVLWGDQVFGLKLFGIGLDHASAGVAKFRRDCLQFVRDDGRDASGRCKNVKKISNAFNHFFVFRNNLVLLKTR